MLLALKTRVQLRYQISTDLQAPKTAADPQQLFTVGTARVFLGGHALERDVTYLLQLAERPRPVSELTFDRDVGVMVYSNAFFADDSPFAFRLGAFGCGGPNQSTPKAAGILLVARVEFRPFGPIDDGEEGDLLRREKPGIALGVGAARNWNSNRQKRATGPAFGGGTVDQSHAVVDERFKASCFRANTCGNTRRRTSSFQKTATARRDLHYAKAEHTGYVLLDVTI